MLLRPKRARNRICAPRHAQKAAAATTPADTRTPEGRGAERRLRVNYRYYNSTDGRWTRRDPDVENYPRLLYIYIGNSPCLTSDYLGEKVTKDMTVDECNREANTYLQQYLRQYKGFDRCNITIKCECNRESFAVTSGQEITMRLPKSATDGAAGLKNTIRHELIHAFDNCKNRPVIDCESMFFAEIRGSYYGQCAQIRSEEKSAQKKE